MSPLQKSAWKKFSSGKLYCNPSPGDSDHDLMEAYCHFFDDMFFFDCVRKHCTLSFSSSTTSSAYGRSVYTDYLGPKFWKWGQIHAKIVIYSRNHKTSRRSKLMRCYITTLLHEMLHVFLELWGCSPCKDRPENIGLGGHGPVWQEVRIGSQKFPM